ncbi:MAG: glutamate--cysteine ligase [Pseudoclavibacter sp.]|nr:glutamate--cysteine ligase [Pseudoclavibacter sp.]
MGKDVSSAQYTRDQRRRFRQKVQDGLDAFERMLANSHFDSRNPMTGLEIELNLVNAQGGPSFHNDEVLHAIADPYFQAELGRHNIELNVAPRPLPGDAALELEHDLRLSLNTADERSRETGSRICSIGILPTIERRHFEQEWMSDNLRYTALNDSIFVSRGEDIELDIEGPRERLRMYTETIAPESACTSVQLHLQVSPQDFADHWNAAQAISGPQLGIAANSPFFFGKRLHDETRIVLFQQATDTRPIELRNQGVRPRVMFGDRWITSIFDLFEENVRYFPALLAELSDEEPLAVLEAGGTPKLHEFNLHNGTIYRWNRPIYDTVGDRPHLRVENRVLPAGPTVADVMANAAFYYGLVRSLVDSERPVWSRLSFSAARENFHMCAKHGMDARIYWPRLGELRVDEFVLRYALPAAQEGLERWRVSNRVIDRYLTIIEERCITGLNGATWQTRAVERLEERGEDRRRALHGMLDRYLEHMHTNEPVHSWPLPE